MSNIENQEKAEFVSAIVPRTLINKEFEKSSSIKVSSQGEQFMTLLLPNSLIKNVEKNAEDKFVQCDDSESEFIKIVLKKDFTINSSVANEGENAGFSKNDLTADEAIELLKKFEVL